MRKRAKNVFHFIKMVVKEFTQNGVIKYSASLSYYTILSIAPLLLILVTITGFVFGNEAVTGQLYFQIEKLVGSDAAVQIQDIVARARLNSGSTFATVIGIIVLFIGATGIFGEIQDSLNRIWGLKIKTKKAWWKIIRDRLISFSLIISLGFVLMVSLVLTAIAGAISARITEWLPWSGDIMVFIVDNAVSLAITTIVFAAIFKVLPDAKIKWKDVLVGAFITSCLFLLGKYGIGYYIGRSNLGNVYGAAGSVMVLMIWVYYSSAILYLGSVVTKVYASNYGGKIYPDEFSVWIKTEEIPVKDIRLKADEPPKKI